MRRILALMLLWTMAAAQQLGQNAQQPQGNQGFTITANTRLVVETVVVKDKQGKPIDGLTARDFTVTEDGVPQEIRFCERQQLPQTPSDAPPIQTNPEDIKIYRELPHNQISPETPGKQKYRDRRLLALYF
ncbi:MAG TPA: VWA domain-containing protein, partial [Candidatus Angelobacter sp.]